MSVKKALEDAGGHAQIISKLLGTIKGADGQEVMVDKSFLTTASVMFDAVFIPGGKKSIDALKANGDAIHFVNEAFKHCKAIGAASEGTQLLEASNIRGLAFTGPQGKVKSDMGVVTVGTAQGVKIFLEEFIEAIAQHRHWGREKMEQIPA